MSADCHLCGLPVGRDAVIPAGAPEGRKFCCTGCAHVYLILEEAGLAQGDFRSSEIYQKSLQLGLISTRSPEAAPRSTDGDSREALYHVSGLWCGSCGWLIEHALLKERGVVAAEVVFTSDLLRVRYNPRDVSPERIPRRVESLGYQASEYSPDTPSTGGNNGDLLLRVGIAGGLWMNVMLFSLVIYASYFEGIAAWARQYVPFILMALTTPAVFYSAWPIHRLALLGLRHGFVRMETLLSTGILAAYGYSVAQALLGGQHYYFDTACAIVTLVLVGKAMERTAKENTARAIALLHRLMPKKARMLSGSREQFVNVDAVEPGMLVLVKPGERIPADGVITEGSSAVDEAVVTGESEPRVKRAGDTVLSGSLNSAGTLEIKVTRRSGESTLAQIVKSVDQALATRTELERMVDQVSRVFVPAVLLIAVATLAGWTAAGLPITETLLRTISVLLIACPCALGIATPLATTAAVGNASRRGILIRDARVLETLGRVQCVVLDKTGTATEGAFRVREVQLQPLRAGAGMARPVDALALAASLETRSEHQLARAIVAEARQRGAELHPASQIGVIPGAGITGLVDGFHVAVGNRALLEQQGISISYECQLQAADWERSGLTVAFMAIDGEAAGLIALGDQLRPDAAPFVAELRARGIPTVLLSGDAPDTTARVAELLGAFGYRGAVSPAAKAEAIEEMRARYGVVAMVGDGINDGPALAAANLGIAMGSGTDLAMQAAPVVLMHDSLGRIVETFDLAARSQRIVRQNLFWAFAYNVGGIGLAVFGLLNPIWAAAAMVVSSLSVIGNSLRLRA
ncbi:MAG: heavy metal translocating P-type ATPase [Acidobacteria bacterium]|nr:heavy metal translocating P-type ATPase [Acidobacteriota bacterium]